MHNDDLRHRVRLCKALLAMMDCEDLWSSDGPTREAKEYLDQYGGPMSKTQWILFQLVWYAWGRPSDVKVQELMQLPEPYGEQVMGLLHAMKLGHRAEEAWLAKTEEAARVSKAQGKLRLA